MVAIVTVGGGGGGGGSGGGGDDDDDDVDVDVDAVEIESCSLLFWLMRRRHTPGAGGRGARWATREKGWRLGPDPGELIT